MVGVIALGRIFSSVGPTPEQMIARQTIEEILCGLDGYLGDSLWENLDGSGEYLTIVEYESEEAAERGRIAMTEAIGKDETLKLPETPVDISFVKIHTAVGESPAKLFVPSFLSISHRVAAPGFGPELAAEMDGILTEIQYIPGCLGVMRAERLDIAEEIVCFASWSSKAAFDDSVPARVFYDLRLYQKVE